MQLLNTIQKDIHSLQEQINSSYKKIANNGYIDTLQNKNTYLKNNEFQSIKEREISAIDTAKSWMNNYDTTFSKLELLIDDYKVASMKDNSSIEKNGILTSIDTLLKTKIKGEDLFGATDSDLVIGDNIKAKKTFSKEWIEYNGANIVDSLKNGDLDTIDSISSFINEKHAQIGARSNVLDNTKTFYENLQLNQNESTISKIYNLEEALAEFSSLNTSYQSLALMANKVAGLSLVNYL